MRDVDAVVLGLRDVGLDHLPADGDTGGERIRVAVERAISRPRSWRSSFASQRIRIGGFALPPLAAVIAAAVATAAATGAVLALGATTLFQQDPQGLDFNGDIETVLPSTVRQLTQVSIPDYGQVGVWIATTKPGGFCFALKLPDGNWGGLHFPQRDGWVGGTVPGCFQTQQQQVLKLPALQPGQQPSAATGQAFTPAPLEE